MSTAQERGRLALLGVLAVCGALGCTSDEAAAPGLCAVRSSPEVASRALVMSFAADPELGGEFGCAATVIAPNLVLTAAHCVSRQVPGPFECDAENGWRLVESGGGQGRIGEPYAPEAIHVEGRNERGLLTRLAGVRELYAFGARTRCQDDLMALILDGELAVEPLPVRLEQSTRRDEELAQLRFSPDDGSTVLEAVRVTELASPLGSLAAPPRALRSSGGQCGPEGGEAIISPLTGALVGLSFILLPAAAGCDAGADVLALQLSEYAGFLREAAERAGAELRVEAAADAPEGDAHCPASVLAPPPDAGR